LEFGGAHHGHHPETEIGYWNDADLLGSDAAGRFVKLADTRQSPQALAHHGLCVVTDVSLVDV
jgi:hypothetical protein